jgi:hypothetical protein
MEIYVISTLCQAADLNDFGFLSPGFLSPDKRDCERSRCDFEIEDNPHLSQLSAHTSIFGLPQNALPLLLHPKAPTTMYRRRKDENKSVVHWGQRKLLMSEISFLSLMGCFPMTSDFSCYPRDSISHVENALQAICSAGHATDCEARITCRIEGCKHSHAPGCAGNRCTAWLVYAGAAPGTHAPVLAAMFPGVRFLLVDPAPFKCRSVRLPMAIYCN